MNKQDFQKKIYSEKAAEIFTEIYGCNEIESIRLRYKLLFDEMMNNHDFQNNEKNNKIDEIYIFSSPGRTELGGNHTDHNRGKVLAASIQMDNAAIVHKRSDNSVFFRSTGYPDVYIKLTDDSGANDLKPKSEEKGTTEALIRGIAAEFNHRGYSVGGFSVYADSTVLPGSGLSSSAAVEVLFGKIFDFFYGKNELCPQEIAKIGQITENIYFGKPCGLMDQTTCAVGGAVTIDFKDAANPMVNNIDFNLTSTGYALCIVNTGGSHADLTPDYASIPTEMKAVAGFFGKSVLREIDKEAVLSQAGKIRAITGDRAMLRSLHFFDENNRVDEMSAALTEMNMATQINEKQTAFYRYLELVNESGESSWKLLQNIYSPKHPEEQAISTALSLTKNYFRKKGIQGACRVHGGGFAGTIQAYLPLDEMTSYQSYIETIFGKGSVTVLQIRPKGVMELIF